MGNSYDAVEEWVQHPVTQRMFKKVHETIHTKQSEVRYTPADYKGAERSTDAIAMFNAYTQGLLDGIRELDVIKKEMIEESKGGADGN
jgi:hypothetical protein